MFINGGGGYDRHGQQFCEGSFLMIADNPDGGNELRAFVRRVKLEQCGHFMMGQVKIQTPRGEAEFTLSGAYGSDGLPMHLQHKNDGQYTWFWEYMHDIPEDLQRAFWAGGGHNTCGSEGPLLRRWALENKTKLNRICKREAADAS